MIRGMERAVHARCRTCGLLHVVLLPLLDIVLVRVIDHLLLVIRESCAGEARPAKERGRQLPRHQLLRHQRARVLAAVAVAPPAPRMHPSSLSSSSQESSMTPF